MRKQDAFDEAVLSATHGMAVACECQLNWRRDTQ